MLQGRGREQEEGRRKERRNKERSSERAWEGSSGFLTQRHILQFTTCRWGGKNRLGLESPCRSLPWKAV